jgi:hypothetical protein
MVRQLLDMSSGIDLSENYMDPAAGIRKLEEAIDWAASKVPGPTGMYPFLGSLERKTAHGDVFDYRSCETTCWAGSARPPRAPPWARCCRNWCGGKIGAESDASMGIDQFGTGVFDRGNQRYAA